MRGTAMKSTAMKRSGCRVTGWALGAGLLAAALAVGCAQSPFRRAGNPAEVGAALARSQPQAFKPANAAGQSLAYLVLEGTAGPRVGAYNLGGKRLLWTQPDEVTTRIAAGATVIVHGSKPAEGSTATAVVTVLDAPHGSGPLEPNPQRQGAALRVRR